MNQKDFKKGYIALMSVIVIGAIAAAVGTTATILATSSTQSTLFLQQGLQANSLANACVETALEHLKDTPTYTGTTDIDPIGSGTCSYTVSNTGGDTRSIESTGVVGRNTKKIEVSLSDNQPVTISSWLEVADF